MNWYYMDGDKQQGPVAHDEVSMLITTGTLKASTPVWREGMDDWQELRKTELITFLPGPVPPPYEKSAGGATNTSSASSQPAPFRDNRSSDLVFPPSPTKSPMHCWWNLLWPGIGNIVLGQVGKGVMLMVVSFVVNLVMPVAGLAIIPASIFDAYKVGKLLKIGQPVGKWAFFPN